MYSFSATGGQLVIVNGPTAELGIHPEHYNEVHGFVPKHAQQATGV